MVLFLSFLVGMSAGVLAAFAGGFVSGLVSKDRKNLAIANKNLNAATAALRRISNPSCGRPYLEADLALNEIESNTYKHLGKGH